MVLSNASFFTIQQVMDAENQVVQISGIEAFQVEYLATRYKHEWFPSYWLGLLVEQSGNEELALGHYQNAVQASLEKEWQPVRRIAELLVKRGNQNEGEQFRGWVKLHRPDLP